MSSHRTVAPSFAAILVLALLAFPVVAHGEGGSGAVGTAVETMDAGGYTYVRLDTPDGEVWIAGPKTAVAAGDRVRIGETMTMTDFHSESLDRTFASIEFVGAIEVVGGNAGATAEAEVAGAHGAAAAPTTVEVGAIERAPGGSTIAELYAKRSEISGKPVVVRGRVVKVNPGIMGRNWIHIQDGSGDSGTGDLTVTTDAVVRVGDVIVVRGTAAADRDFGMGYRYDLIVEQAGVTVE